MPRYQNVGSDCGPGQCVPQDGTSGCRPCSDEAQQLMREGSKSGSFRMDFTLPGESTFSGDQRRDRSQRSEQLDRSQRVQEGDCELSGNCQPRGGQSRVGVNIGFGPSHPDYFPNRWNAPQNNNIGQQALHSLLYSAMRTQFNDRHYDQMFQPGGYNPRFQPRYDDRYQPGWDQGYDQRFQPRVDIRFQPQWDHRYDQRFQPEYDQRLFQPGYDQRFQPGYDTRFQPGRYQPDWDQADYVNGQRFQPQYHPRYQPGYDERFQPGYDPRFQPGRYQPGWDQAYDTRFQPGCDTRFQPQRYYPGGGGCFPGGGGGFYPGGGGFYPGGFRPGCNSSNFGQQILFNAVLPMIMNQVGRNQYRNFHRGGGQWCR